MISRWWVVPFALIVFAVELGWGLRGWSRHVALGGVLLALVLARIDWPRGFWR